VARTAAATPAAGAAPRCSVLGALAIVGDFWTLGVLRCVVFGMHRFGDFERELGVATNVLTDRLHRLVDAGVLERVPYRSNPPRSEYVLTDAGRELVPVVLALKLWGDRHLQPDGPLTAVHHQGCASPVEVRVVCPDCGATPADGATEVVVLRPPPA